MIDQEQINQLSTEHVARLERELDEGERVLWVAQPSEQHLLKQAKFGSLVVALLLGVFGISFFVLSLMRLIELLPPNDQGDIEHWLFMLGGLILIGIGLYSRSQWIRSTKWEARNTIYAITHARAIILVLKRDGSSTERDYCGEELTHLARTETADGVGTLTFESARGSSGTMFNHRFQAIEDVIEVERLLRKQFGES